MSNAETDYNFKLPSFFFFLPSFKFPSVPSRLLNRFNQENSVKLGKTSGRHGIRLTNRPRLDVTEFFLNFLPSSLGSGRTSGAEKRNRKPTRRLPREIPKGETKKTKQNNNVGGWRRRRRRRKPKKKRKKNKWAAKNQHEGRTWNVNRPALLCSSAPFFFKGVCVCVCLPSLPSFTEFSFQENGGERRRRWDHNETNEKEDEDLMMIAKKKKKTPADGNRRIPSAGGRVRTPPPPPPTPFLFGPLFIHPLPPSFFPWKLNRLPSCYRVFLFVLDLFSFFFYSDVVLIESSRPLWRPSAMRLPRAFFFLVPFRPCFFLFFSF